MIKLPHLGSREEIQARKYHICRFVRSFPQATKNVDGPNNVDRFIIALYENLDEEYARKKRCLGIRFQARDGHSAELELAGERREEV